MSWPSTLGPRDFCFGCRASTCPSAIGTTNVDKLHNRQYVVMILVIVIVVVVVIMIMIMIMMFTCVTCRGLRPWVPGIPKFGKARGPTATGSNVSFRAQQL